MSDDSDKKTVCSAKEKRYNTSKRKRAFVSPAYFSFMLQGELTMNNSKTKVFRILLIVAGALAIVQFFVYPFMVFSRDAIAVINETLEDGGYNLKYPSLLSCFTYILFFFQALAEAGEEITSNLKAVDIISFICMFLVLVTGILTLIFGIIGKKAGFIGAICSAAVMLVANIFLVVVVAADINQLNVIPGFAGVRTNPVYFLILLVPLLALTAAILGLVLPGQASEAEGVQEDDYVDNYDDGYGASGLQDLWRQGSDTYG